jgi:hypothetical protein
MPQGVQERRPVWGRKKGVREEDRASNVIQQASENLIILTHDVIMILIF